MDILPWGGTPCRCPADGRFAEPTRYSWYTWSLFWVYGPDTFAGTHAFEPRVCRTKGAYSRRNIRGVPHFCWALLSLCQPHGYANLSQDVLGLRGLHTRAVFLPELPTRCLCSKRGSPLTKHTRSIATVGHSLWTSASMGTLHPSLYKWMDKLLHQL